MTSSDFMPEQSIEAQANALGEFDPRIHPELALQTYESFAGDAGRKTARAAFENGQTYHFEMTYPLLRTETAVSMRDELNALRAMAVEKYGEDSLTVSSIDYRITETEFLESAALMNELATRGDAAKEELQAEAERFVSLNDRLYGKSDQVVVDGALSEAKRRYTSDDPRITQLWAEIEHGFETTLADGRVVAIPGIDIPSDVPFPYPELSDTAAEMLEQEWKLAFPAVTEARGLVGDIVAVEEGLASDYEPALITLNGLHTAHMFRIASEGISQQHGSQPFNVEVNDGTDASWDSSRMAIVVGLNRLESKGKWHTMLGTGYHEAMHGLKNVNGLLSGEPALATGVYSRNEDGTYTDYLTFEEGNNGLGESIVNGSEESARILENVMLNYLVAGLVYRGMDDRQVKEMVGKLITIERLFMAPKSEQPEVEVMVGALVTTKIERFFRSTSASAEVMVDGHKPIFTKDLAYFNGKVKAIPFWNDVAAEAQQEGHRAYEAAVEGGMNYVAAMREERRAAQAYMHRIFEIQSQGKIDPTEPRQYAAAEKAYEQRKTMVMAS